MAGISPRAGRNGAVSWRVSFRVDGRMAQQTFATEEAARSFGKLVDRVGGKAAQAVRRERQGETTTAPIFSEFATRYLDEQSGLLSGVTEGTRNAYKSIAKHSLDPILGEIPVDAIQKSDIGRWLAWQTKQESVRTKAPVSAKTVKNHHALLSAILRAAVAEKLRSDNPAHGTKLPEGERREGVFLTRGEVEAIVTKLKPRYRPLVNFLVATGCRWGEATALTWGDINTDVTPPTVRITKAWKKSATSRPVIGPPKSKKARRTIAVWPEVIAELGTPGRSNELVFQNENGNHLWSSGFINRQWRPAVLASGISKEPNVHDLRHTSASFLIAEGVPLPYIQARLGHEKITTTIDVYGHLLPNAHIETALAMQRALSPAQPALD